MTDITNDSWRRDYLASTMKKPSRKSTPIRKSAKGQDCTALIEGCSPGPENETVVFAHAPYFHRGGMRSADHWGCYCCHNCHGKLDGRIPWGHGQIKYGNETATSSQVLYEKIDVWFHAICRTQRILIAKGLITIGARKGNGK